MPNVKLTLVASKVNEHINYSASDRTDTTWRVDLDGEPIGYVLGIWAVEHLNVRSEVARSWATIWLDGKPTRLGDCLWARQ